MSCIRNKNADFFTWAAGVLLSVNVHSNIDWLLTTPRRLLTLKFRFSTSHQQIHDISRLPSLPIFTSPSPPTLGLSLSLSHARLQSKCCRGYNNTWVTWNRVSYTKVKNNISQWRCLNKRWPQDEMLPMLEKQFHQKWNLKHAPCCSERGWEMKMREELHGMMMRQTAQKVV